MLIKHPYLSQHLKKQLIAVYVLIGQDSYLLNEACQNIKSALKAQKTPDEQTLSIQTADDWHKVFAQANSFSLFADDLMLTAHYDKKTIDAATKKIINNYLQSPNSRTTLIIQAPNLPQKQLSWLISHEHVLVVQAYPLNQDEMKRWIAKELHDKTIDSPAQAPELIWQYTQGNMLAAAQVIEKLSLSALPNTALSLAEIQSHLSDQCEFSLFELVERCLQGQADLALHIIRQAAQNKTESTLVLWILTQEIRYLLQLHYLTEQNKDIRTACADLKIWPNRVPLYQVAFKRITLTDLRQLLHYCQRIDERIKSTNYTQVWNALETVALSLCLGRLIGETCKA